MNDNKYNTDNNNNNNIIIIYNSEPMERTRHKQQRGTINNEAQ